MTTNKQLRELAEKATPGPWHESNGLGIVIDEIDCGTVCETHEDDAHDGRFIAAANPVTVLALLDAHEALQAECEHYKSAIAEITARHFAERWVNAASNKELEQYLSDGIAQLQGEYRKQVEALQAECEKLRKDAEARRESIKLLNYLFARSTIAMQSAVIEWEKGKGAAAGMQWIWNTLCGPGLIPEEDETDAQAFFDREIEPLDAAVQADNPC